MARRTSKLELEKPQEGFSHILSEEDLAHALAALQESDPGPIGRMLAAAGTPPLRRRPGGVAGLAWIVVSQQVSAASASAIHGRLEARFPDMAAGRLLAASDDDLRSCGLSAPKMRTLRAIAAAIEAGALDLAAIERLDADAARQALTQVKGIGPWSADVYLLFCLGQPDVWPAGDLALQEAVRMALGLRSRPDAKRMERIGERWRPWRAAAARLLWAYYGAMRAPARRGA
jgi:DNA-3-methyladenine glycosylase II